CRVVSRALEGRKALEAARTFEAAGARARESLSPFQGSDVGAPAYQGFAPLANHCRPSRADAVRRCAIAWNAPPRWLLASLVSLGLLAPCIARADPPVLTTIAPRGLARGQSVELTLTGDRMSEATGALCRIPNIPGALAPVEDANVKVEVLEADVK